MGFLKLATHHLNQSVQYASGDYVGEHETFADVVAKLSQIVGMHSRRLLDYDWSGGI